MVQREALLMIWRACVLGTLGGAQKRPRWQAQRVSAGETQRVTQRARRVGSSVCSVGHALGTSMALWYLGAACRSLENVPFYDFRDHRPIMRRPPRRHSQTGNEYMHQGHISPLERTRHPGTRRRCRAFHELKLNQPVFDKARRSVSSVSKNAARLLRAWCDPAPEAPQRRKARAFCFLTTGMRRSQGPHNQNPTGLERAGASGIGVESAAPARSGSPRLVQREVGVESALSHWSQLLKLESARSQAPWV